MSILKMVAVAFLISLSLIAQSMANTEVKVHVKNNTFGTLKMTSISGLDRVSDTPLVLYNVGPGTAVDLHFNYNRAFSYGEGQLYRNKVEPVRLVLEYEVHGYKCKLQTSLIAAVESGVFKDSYEPAWPTRVIPSGDEKYKCNAAVSKRKFKPPFSYTVEFTIGKPSSGATDGVGNPQQLLDELLGKG